MQNKPDKQSDKIAIERPRGISRRDFLKLMGASAVMLTSQCRRPVEKIVPAILRPAEVQPGIPTEYCTVAPDGSGIVAYTRSARPLKLLGNRKHPFNQGALSASMCASLMDLYDPDRLRRPLSFTRSENKDLISKKYTTEELIIPIARSKLQKGNYVLVTPAIHSPSSKKLIQAFLAKFPGGRHVQFQPDPSLRQIAAGQELSYGTASIPAYRFDKAELILSIEGDFMGTMPLANAYTPEYAKKRNLKNSVHTMNRLLVFESMYTLTGSNADERYAIRPGDQALIALVLAAHITLDMQRGIYAQDDSVRSLLKGYLPNNITSVLKQRHGLYRKGYFEKVIARIAEELWEHRGRSLVLGASPVSAIGDDPATANIAMSLLNSILENDGRTIDYAHPYSFLMAIAIENCNVF